MKILRRNETSESFDGSSVGSPTESVGHIRETVNRTGTRALQYDPVPILARLRFRTRSYQWSISAEDHVGFHIYVRGLGSAREVTPVPSDVRRYTCCRAVSGSVCEGIVSSPPDQGSADKFNVFRHFMPWGHAVATESNAMALVQAFLALRRA